MDVSDIDYLKELYQKASSRYQPKSIRVLFIAEAPPCALERYFYFEDVKRQDSLFLEIMGILYPEEKAQYLSSGRETERKKDLLKRFKEDGFFLMDLSEIPTSITNTALDNELPSLIRRLEKTVHLQTPIILIKSNVYDTCYDALVSKRYNVVNERIPFPGSGQQKVFREKMKKVLDQC